MKKISLKPLIYFFTLIIIMMMHTSCEEGFEELNKSPDLVEEPNLDYMLPTIQLTLMERAYYTNMTYTGRHMHQVITYGFQFNDVPQQGGEYTFEWLYPNTVKNLVDFIDKSSANEDHVNYVSIGRILKVYVLHRLTDLYGDIPYFEAGKGYLDQNFEPAYDPQKAIYEDMFKELEEAALALDESKPKPTEADIIYQGDLNKWKKFAYSLMLRMGLRLSEVEPENAKNWVSKAIKGGVMDSNEDNCYVMYEPDTYYATTANGQATPFLYYNTWKLSETFVEYLKAHDDPRLSVYSALPNGDNTPGKQKGLPALPTDEITLPLESFSISNPNTIGRYGAPFMHLSYSQVQFMLAECAVREWIEGDDKIYYENGVRAAMNELAIYGEEGIVSDEEIELYLAKNPYNPTNDKEAFNLINTQYWVETHYNFLETFANWRRTDYPNFEEMAGHQVLIRRATYPASEVNINAKNVQEAIARQGPNLTTTRVWWDKE